MQARLAFLALLCGFVLCSCTKQPDNSGVYNPAYEPLTAEELADLLGVSHWKITQTPNDGKPYCGVRLIVANRGFATVGDDPPYRMLYQTGALLFDAPMKSNSNPKLLLGLQISAEKITGQISATSPQSTWPLGTYTTRFQIPHSAYRW